MLVYQSLLDGTTAASVSATEHECVCECVHTWACASVECKRARVPLNACAVARPVVPGWLIGRRP